MSTATIPQVRFRTIDGVRIRYADSGSSPKPADAGHFVWEEEPAQYASAILDSITANRS